VLILSDHEVKNIISMEEAISVIKYALKVYTENNYLSPQRVFTKVGEDNNTFMLMPSIVGDSIGLKTVTTYPNNHKHNEQVTQGLIIIYDRKTGKPLSLMNGTQLTAIKTGAVSGVAMELLKPKAQTVGLVGTGLQGLYQLKAALASTKVKKIYLFNRTAKKVNQFKKELTSLTDKTIDIIHCENINELINYSEIIITATTSKTPVIPNEAKLYDGKLVIGVGSFMPYMRELPRYLYTSADYFIIDSKDGIKEVGDIKEPIEQTWIKHEKVLLLSDVLLENKSKQFSQESTIVFKTISMALFDALMGEYVYRKSANNNIGTYIFL